MMRYFSYVTYKLFHSKCNVYTLIRKFFNINIMCVKQFFLQYKKYGCPFDWMVIMFQFIVFAIKNITCHDLKHNIMLTCFS